MVGVTSFFIRYGLKFFNKKIKGTPIYN